MGYARPNRLRLMQVQGLLRPGACPGVATRRSRRQKPRFLPPEVHLMSEKSAEGDFFPMK
jgi:hypothetical protein